MPDLANNNYISNPELRSAIQQQLREDGVFNEITAAIRSRILQSLLHENGPKEAMPGDKEMALLSLFSHHLEKRGMVHTLSVFAAESKMEHSLKYPLSFDAAIKTLGLEVVRSEFYHKGGKADEDPPLLLLLQAAAQSVLSQQEMERGAVKTASPAQVSKSAQTDSKLIPRAFSNDASANSECNKENRLGNDCEVEEMNNKLQLSAKKQANKLIEQRVVEIERECQQRMRQEMNGKLRLSAKKQAAVATRRLEQKHKAALQSLRHQMEAERSQAQSRWEELAESMSQQKIALQKESSEKDQRLQTILFEKQTMQSEMDLLNERVKEMQQRRFKEWTDQHEDLAEQKRHLQMQLNEISIQRDGMKSKEMKISSLEQDRDRLLAQIQDERHQQTNSLKLQQSSFNESKSDLEARLQKIKHEYQAAKSDLDASRSEAAGLRTLLKQLHAAMSTLSFREIGISSTNINVKPPIYRSATRIASQIGPIATPSGSNIVPFSRPSLTHSATTNSHDTSSPPPSELRTDPRLNGSPEHMCLNSPLRNKSPRQVGGNLHQQERKTQTVSNETTSNAQSVVPEDPPCSSAEDPPGMTERRKAHLKGQRNDRSKECRDTGIILNLSAITEEVSLEKGFAKASVSYSPKDAQAKPSHSEQSSPHIAATTEHAMSMEKLNSNANGRGNMNRNTEHIESHESRKLENDLNRELHLSVSSHGSSDEESPILNKDDLPRPESKYIGEEDQLESNSAESGTSASVNIVHLSTASIASAVINSGQYSECFHTIDGETKDSIHGASYQPGDKGDVFLERTSENRTSESDAQLENFRNPKPKSLFPVSLANSSGEYSESFYSDEK